MFANTTTRLPLHYRTSSMDTRLPLQYWTSSRVRALTATTGGSPPTTRDRVCASIAAASIARCRFAGLGRSGGGEWIGGSVGIDDSGRKSPA